MKKLKKFMKGTGTKIFAILTAVFLLIPMLCAFTYPLTVSITNPDNLPFEALDAYFNSTDLQLGTTVVDSSPNLYLSQFVSGSPSPDLLIPDGYCFGGTVRPPDYQDEIFYSTTFIMNNAEALVNKKLTVTGHFDYTITSYEILAIYPDAEPISYGIAIPRYGMMATVFYADGDSVDFKLSSDQTLFENIYDTMLVYGAIMGQDYVPTYEEFLSELGTGVPVVYIYIDIQDIPSPTASIKDVWTGILDWITGALTSIQGLFITQGNDPDPTHLKAGTYRFNDVVIMPDNPFSFHGDFSCAAVVSDGEAATSLDNIFSISVGHLDGMGSLIGYNLAFNQSVIFYKDGYLDEPIILDNGNESPIKYSYSGDIRTFTLDQDFEADETVGSWVIANTNYNEVNGYSHTSLTLIGTLTVIGLAIAVSFLIIGIIQRFLKLRG